jgi:1-acyl-sn-glycerol-3-phosphate acyltransferase
LVLRSLLFNFGLWSWTLLLVILCLPLLLLPRGAWIGAARVWKGGIRAMLRTLVGLDHEVRGRARVPVGPVIYAFKHQSAWETLTLHLLIDDPAIALKRELTLIPLFGWYALRAGMIRIDRGHGTRALRSLIRNARRAVARGQSVVIFPEGTRVAPGARRPYHPGVAALYLQLGLPVVPVALNSGLFWGRRAFVKQPGRITVEFLEPIPPGLDRRRFMEVLEESLETATNRLVAEARARSGEGQPRRETVAG